MLIWLPAFGQWLLSVRQHGVDGALHQDPSYKAQADYSQGRELEKVMQLIIQGIAINESLGNREAH